MMRDGFKLLMEAYNKVTDKERNLSGDLEEYFLDRVPSFDDIVGYLDSVGIYTNIVDITGFGKCISTEDHVVTYDSGNRKYPMSVYTKREFIDGNEFDEMVMQVEKRFNEDFWHHPGLLYHATSNVNAEKILKDKLSGSSGTGLNNRSTHGIFTVSDPSWLESGTYGDYIIIIDAAAMKRDGLQPTVAMEPDVVIDEAKGAIAHLLEYDEYSPENVDAGWPTTVIILTNSIPAKYLRVREK